MKDRKFNFKSKPTGYIGTFLFGIGFLCRLVAMRRPDFNGHHRAGDFRSGNLVPTDYLVLPGVCSAFFILAFSSAQPAGFSSIQAR